MFNRLVKDLMDPAKAITISREDTVTIAAKLMEEKATGAVMVVEKTRLIGIFTERDALFRVIARGLDPRATKLAEVMTPDPNVVGPTSTYGHALLLMQEGGFRHVPVVDDGKPIGIIGSRNALDPDLEEFASEANRRNYIRQSK